MNRMSEEKQRYLEAMKDSAFASLTQEDQAKELSVARETISRWNREFPWQEIFRGQLENAGRRCGKILEALIKKAEKGNLGAIGMLFEVLGVLKNTLVVKVENEFKDASYPELTAGVLRDTYWVSEGLKLLTVDEREALKTAVLAPVLDVQPVPQSSQVPQYLLAEEKRETNRRLGISEEAPNA